MNKRRENPPIFTVLSEIVGWTLDRTADFPKSQRFTFGQRIDNLSLDALQFAVKAIRARQRLAKEKNLHDLDLLLEQLRVLWRLVHERGWISRQQLVFIQGRLDETGRMVGGWLAQLAAKGAE
jgi:hypothetical protein